MGQRPGGTQGRKKSWPRGLVLGPPGSEQEDLLSRVVWAEAEWGPVLGMCLSQPKGSEARTVLRGKEQGRREEEKPKGRGGVAVMGKTGHSSCVALECPHPPTPLHHIPTSSTFRALTLISKGKQGLLVIPQKPLPHRSI